MKFSRLIIFGNTSTAIYLAFKLFHVFEGSSVISEMQQLEGDETLVFIDDGGHENERILWEKFGNPSCILHICNDGTPYDLHGAYQRVNVDFNNIPKIEAEVKAFLRDNGLYLEESIEKK